MQVNERFYDVIIVGAGPAGLSAAIYAARAKYRVLVLEKAGIGGQITITSEIVNYPGVELTSGKELTEKMRIQAENFGAEFAIAEVLNLDLDGDVKSVSTTKGTYETLGIVLAPGANPRKLGFKGEKEFQGRGVAYCATCDGEFFTGRDVFVIGGGFAAVEEGMFLTKYARSVTLIVREPDFTCAKTTSDQLSSYSRIKVKFKTELLEAGGEGMLQFARFRDNGTGETWEYHTTEKETFGIFVFAGYVPNTAWLPQGVERDESGYLITDINRKTSLDGVYAAGDVCVKNLRQVVTAVSDGAIAATSLEKIVSELHKKLKIPELVRKESKPVSHPVPDQPKQSHKEGFISEEIRSQLGGIFAKFEHRVLIKAYLDGSPLSAEITGFLRELESLTDKVTWKKEANSGTDLIRPALELCREDGSGTGIRFHGVPGGHEFNSFIIALYNVAGPGQESEPSVKEKAAAIREPKNLKVLVSLSCTMCPETVMSAQKIAALNEKVSAEMFDLAHFPQLKEQYQVMSVPCVILNDETVFFGKKGVEELLDLIL